MPMMTTARRKPAPKPVRASSALRLLPARQRTRCAARHVAEGGQGGVEDAGDHVRPARSVRGPCPAASSRLFSDGSSMTRFEQRRRISPNCGPGSSPMAFRSRPSMARSLVVSGGRCGQHAARVPPALRQVAVAALRGLRAPQRDAQAEQVVDQVRRHVQQPAAHTGVRRVRREQVGLAQHQAATRSVSALDAFSRRITSSARRRPWAHGRCSGSRRAGPGRGRRACPRRGAAP
jgi:hypothetical protein